MPQSPRTAYIHIGAPKTGSTAIQAAFSAAKDQLSESGYHYLDGDRNHSEMLAMSFWAEQDALKLGQLRWIDDEDEFFRHRASLREALSEQISRSVSRNLIISAEELSDFREPEVQSFITFLQQRFDRIRVIAYAREPQSWMTSAAQQGVKWSGDRLDERFQAPRLPEYQRRFEPFMTAVGQENFDLRPYFPGEKEFDVVADFARAIGIGEKIGANSAESRVNSAVSHRTAIIFSAVNAAMPPFVENRHNPCRSFNVVRDGRLPGRKFALPSETVLNTADILQDERGWLNETMGRAVFTAPAVPEIPLDSWYGGEREELEAFAAVFSAHCRQAQNDEALKAYLKSKKHREANPGLARALLSNAWMLATDQWTLHLIATEAVETEHPDRHRFFAKQRIMRRIENAQPGDPPLAVGNPFHREW
ncbi:hypothetical protein ACFMBG_21160 [Leisingera sp. D0M16]|uniref:hypothetical protein n=1 Tax=Leisingera coralii TaxID=3351347 RepID=UPI003B7826E7